jgi:hypothetical protein
MLDYFTTVEKLFYQGQYPAVADLVLGHVIMDCWLKHYETAEDVLKAIEGKCSKYGIVL